MWASSKQTLVMFSVPRSTAALHGARGVPDDGEGPWASSEQTLLMFSVPRSIAALHGAHGVPDDGDSFSVSFNLIADPYESAVMTFSTGFEANDTDNAACAGFAGKLGDDLAAALGGRIAKADFVARFRDDA